MTAVSSEILSNETNPYFQEIILENIKKIIAKNYTLDKISIKTLEADGSRLSSPVKISGVERTGESVTYFGKIITNGDIFTYRSIQFLKNVYLGLHEQEPIFGIFETTKEMAESSYETLQRLNKIGIPSAKQYGCHLVVDSTWLLVSEYLFAKPISIFKSIDPGVLNTTFRYLSRMHHKKIFHGDLKPDNILLGDKIYILDVGYLRKDAPVKLKRAYDIACLICCFLEYHAPKDILKVARKYYSKRNLEVASIYMDLIQMRPDIHFSDESKKTILQGFSG